MDYIPIELVMLLGLVVALSSAFLRKIAKEKYGVSTAFPYFIGLGIFVFGAWNMFFVSEERIYYYEGSYPIEHSKGGDVNNFFEFQGELYNADKQLPEDYGDSVYVYVGEKPTSKFRSVFSPEKIHVFRKDLDTYLIRKNKNTEKVE